MVQDLVKQKPLLPKLKKILNEPMPISQAQQSCRNRKKADNNRAEAIKQATNNVNVKMTP